MSTPKFFLVLSCIMAATSSVTSTGHQSVQPMEAPETDASVEAPKAAAPGVECMSLIHNMVDCVSYLSVGSNDTRPTLECCSGLKKVLDTDAECVCEGLKASAAMGLIIDMNRAVGLPSACKIKGPSLSSCNISNAPGAAPAKPPTGPAPAPAPVSPRPPAPVSPPSSSPAPTPIDNRGGRVVQHPPVPAPSTAYALRLPSAVHFTMLVASFLLYLSF